METPQQRPVVGNPMVAEDLTPTPTQAENDAAMIAATGGDAAPGTPPPSTRSAPAEHAHAPAREHHEPERRERH